jgi:hypothetical protein
MTLTLQFKASWRSSSNPRRTNCSGRGTGARNLGLSTILLGGSTLGSPEARMMFSSIWHRQPGPHTPARPSGHAYGATTRLIGYPCTSNPTTSTGRILLFVKLSRPKPNPAGSGDCELSHKQRCKCTAFAWPASGSRTGSKSPRGNRPLGDESLPGARLHWHAKEASCAGGTGRTG